MNKKDLKHIAPNLHEIKKRMKRDEIPSNYFENIENEIFNKISNENDSVPNTYFKNLENKVIHKLNTQKKSLLRRLTPYAIAASILLIITIQLSIKSNDSNSFSSLNTDDIESWILEENISTYEITNTFNETHIDYTESLNYIDNNEIEDYLFNQDLSSIIN